MNEIDINSIDDAIEYDDLVDVPDGYWSPDYSPDSMVCNF